MGGITLQELKEYRQKNGIDAKTSTIKNQGIVSKEQSDRIHSVRVPDGRTPGKFVERYRNPALFLGAKFIEAAGQAEGEPDRGVFNVNAYEKLGNWLTAIGDAWARNLESYKKEQEITPEVIDGVPQTLLGNIGFGTKEEPVSEFTMHLSRIFGLETDVERRGLEKLLYYDDHKVGRELYEMIVEELPLRRSPMQREKVGTMFGEAEFDKADIHQIIMSNILSVGVGGFMAGENGTTVAAEGHSLIADMVQKVSGLDRKAALQLVDRWSVQTMVKLANNAREIGEFTEQEINPYAWTQDPRQISTADPRMHGYEEVYQPGITYRAARVAGVVESSILSMLDAPFSAVDFKDRMLKKISNPVIRTAVDCITSRIPTGKRLGFETAEDLENFRILFDPIKSPLANINPGVQETRMYRQLEARREGLGALTKHLAVEGAFDYAALVAGIVLTKKLIAKTGLASLVKGKAPLSAAKTARLARTAKGGLTHTVLNKAELARSLSATFRNAAFMGAYRAITTPGSFEDRVKAGLIVATYASSPGWTGLILHKLGITNPGVVIPVFFDMFLNMGLTTGLSHIPEYKRQGGFTDDFIANAVVQTMMDGLMSVTTRGIRDADRIMDIARTRYGKYYDGVAKNGKVVDLISGKQVSRQQYIDGKIQQRHNQPSAVTEAYIQMLKEKTTKQVDIPGLKVPKVEIKPYQDPDVRQYLKAEQKLLSKRGEIEGKRLEVETKIGELEGRTDRTPQEQRSLAALKGRKTRLDNQLARMEGEGEPELTKDPEAQPTTKKSKYEGYVTQIQSINRQIAQFNKGLKAGKNIAAKDIKAFQDHISKVIDETGILTKDQKNTLRKQTRNLHPIKRTKKGRENARKSLSQLRNKIQELSDENEMRVFKNAAKRVLNKAKKDIKKGKFDPDTANALNRAIYINRVPGEARDDIGSSSADMLEYDIGQLHRVTLTKGQARGIYNDLIRVYNRGAATRAAWKAAKEAEANQIVRLAISDLTGKAAEDVKLLTPEQFQQKGNLFGWWFNFLRGSRHWPGLMTDLTQYTQTRPGESNIERFTDMGRTARYKDELMKKYNNKKVDIFNRIFGVKNRFQIKDKYDQDLQDKVQIPLKGKESAVINRAIARQRWAEWQQDPGRARLQGKNKYTPDTIKKIEQFLNPEDFDLIRETRKLYDEFYQEVNDVFRMDRGYDLPYRKGYTPFIVEFAHKTYEGADLIDQMHFDARKEPVIDNKSPLQELKGKTAGIKAQGDIALLDRYIQDMSHYVSHAKTIERAKTIFSNEQVRQIIAQKYGKHMVDTLDAQLDTLTRGKLEAAQRNIWGGLNTLKSAWVKGVLYFSPKRTTVQLLSTGLYLTEMPASAFAKGLLDLPRAIKSGEIRAITDTAWFSERGIGLERDLAQLTKTIESPEFNQFKRIVDNPRLDHFGGMFMKIGDRSAILAGGWSLYKHLTRTKKMDKVEALDRVINFSNKTQQSKDLAQMGTILQTGNPFVGTLTMFKNTTGQFYNNYLDALVNRARISKVELAKTLLAYHGMAGFYAVINSGLKIATVGALASFISGPMGDGIAIGGEFFKNLVGWVLAKAKDEDYRAMSSSYALEAWFRDVYDVADITLDLIQKGEYAGADDILGVAEAWTRMSYPFTGGAGALANRATRSFNAAREYVDDEDFYKMLQKFMGYTDWQIKQMRGQ